jgi:hypothetical protein
MGRDRRKETNHYGKSREELDLILRELVEVEPAASGNLHARDRRNAAT